MPTSRQRPRHSGTRAPGPERRDLPGTIEAASKAYGLGHTLGELAAPEYSSWAAGIALPPTPLLDLQTRHALELGGVVRHQRQRASARLSGMRRIDQRSDAAASSHLMQM